MINYVHASDLAALPRFELHNFIYCTYILQATAEKKHEQRMI